MLTVAQNFSTGWEAYDGSGRKLVPMRVGGWQQGWMLPAGPEQVVTARFTPDRDYRAGLLVGLFALPRRSGPGDLRPPRRSRHSGHRLREGRGRAVGRHRAGWCRRDVHGRLDRTGGDAGRGSCSPGS